MQFLLDNRFITSAQARSLEALGERYGMTGRKVYDRFEALTAGHPQRTIQRLIDYAAGRRETNIDDAFASMVSGDVGESLRRTADFASSEAARRDALVLGPGPTLPGIGTTAYAGQLAAPSRTRPFSSLRPDVDRPRGRLTRVASTGDEERLFPEPASAAADPDQFDRNVIFSSGSRHMELADSDVSAESTPDRIRQDTPPREESKISQLHDAPFRDVPLTPPRSVQLPIPLDPQAADPVIGHDAEQLAGAFYPPIFDNLARQGLHEVGRLAQRELGHHVVQAIRGDGNVQPRVHIGRLMPLAVGALGGAGAMAYEQARRYFQPTHQTIKDVMDPDPNPPAPGPSPSPLSHTSDPSRTEREEKHLFDYDRGESMENPYARTPQPLPFGYNNYPNPFVHQPLQNQRRYNRRNYKLPIRAGEQYSFVEATRVAEADTALSMY